MSPTGNRWSVIRSRKRIFLWTEMIKLCHMFCVFYVFHSRSVTFAFLLRVVSVVWLDSLTTLRWRLKVSRTLGDIQERMKVIMELKYYMNIAQLSVLAANRVLSYQKKRLFLSLAVSDDTKRGLKVPSVEFLMLPRSQTVHSCLYAYLPVSPLH